MKACKRGELLLLLVMLPACGQQLVEFPQNDGAILDAGMADVIILDAAIPDAAIADVPIVDAPRADAATTNAESADGSDPGPLASLTRMWLPGRAMGARFSGNEPLAMKHEGASWSAA